MDCDQEAAGESQSPLGGSPAGLQDVPYKRDDIKSYHIIIGNPSIGHLIPISHGGDLV